MTPVDLDLYARAVAAALKPRRLSKSTVRLLLVNMDLSGVDADAVIAHGIATGLFAEAPVFGEAYLFAAPPKA